jgi:AraC-like DNA-binding protein
MVSARCKMAVQTVLEELSIKYQTIELGEVKLTSALNAEQQKKLNAALKNYELELMGDKKKVMVERIKTLITETFSTDDTERQLKLSEHLSKTLGSDYTYLANTFSEIAGLTIERFYISARVERVKELLAHEGLSIKEIADQLNYSSVAHLCMQFKKVTGKTPTMFKKSGAVNRQPLKNV